MKDAQSCEECVSGGVLLTHNPQPQLGLYILTSCYYYYVIRYSSVSALYKQKKIKNPYRNKHVRRSHKPQRSKLKIGINWNSNRNSSPWSSD